MFREKVKCAECEKEGKRSTVQFSVREMPAVYRPSYYDEDGNYVMSKQISEDITNYVCSNGHKWSEQG